MKIAKWRVTLREVKRPAPLSRGAQSSLSHPLWAQPLLGGLEQGEVSGAAAERTVGVGRAPWRVDSSIPPRTDCCHLPFLHPPLGSPQSFTFTQSWQLAPPHPCPGSRPAGPFTSGPGICLRRNGTQQTANAEGAYVVSCGKEDSYSNIEIEAKLESRGQRRASSGKWCL